MVIIFQKSGDPELDFDCDNSWRLMQLDLVCWFVQRPPNVRLEQININWPLAAELS